MMKYFVPILVILLGFSVTEGFAQDQGKKVVGKLKVSLYFASDGDVSVAGEGVKVIDEVLAAKFRGSDVLKFKDYRLLGSDIQSIMRSYENWIAPMKPSEEILLSFEPRGEPRDGSLVLDLEFWQSRKKIMKSGPVLEVGKPLYILGPSWRGGKLIVAVELQSLTT